MSVEGADASRVDIKKVEKAFDDMGDAGAKVATPVTRALDFIQKGLDRYETKLAQGKSVTSRDVTAMVQQWTHLSSTIDESGLAIQDFPDEVQRALAKAEAQVKKVTAEFGKMDDAVRDNTANAKIAGDSWPGLGNALEGMGGKVGTATAKFGLYTAALSEGWQMGKKLAAGMGTDFSAMEQAVDSFVSKAKSVNSTFLSWMTGDGSFESVRASIALTKEQLEGYNSTVLAGITDLGDYKDRTVELNQIQAAHAVILAEGIEGQKLASQAKRDAAGVLKDYIVSLDMASEAAKVHNTLLKYGAEGEQLWNEIRVQGKGGLLELAQAISDNSGRIAELTRKTLDQVEAERALQEAVNDTSASIERRLAMEKQQAELIANQEKVEDSLTASLRNKLAEISASMVVKEGKEIPLTKLQISQFESLLAGTVGLTDAERKRHIELVAKLKTVETMSQYQREELAREIQRQLLINTATFTDEAHRVVLDKKTKTISNAAAESEKLNSAQIKVTTSSGTAADAATRLDGGFGKLGASTRIVEAGVRGAGDGLADFALNANAHVAEMEKVIAAFNRIEAAANKAGTAVRNASKAGLD